MNERIEELLYEAGGQYGGENHLIGKTRIYTDDVDYEKFAELLIGEYAEEVRQINDGERVVLPKNREHAEAMVRVGMHYLEQNK